MTYFVGAKFTFTHFIFATLTTTLCENIVGGFFRTVFHSDEVTDSCQQIMLESMVFEHLTILKTRECSVFGTNFFFPIENHGERTKNR